jgi:hypothetical protein
MQEARERQCVLVAQGKSNLSARFHTADLTCEAIPLEDASMDVLSAMFFLQFMFCSEPAEGLPQQVVWVERTRRCDLVS